MSLLRKDAFLSATSLYISSEFDPIFDCGTGAFDDDSERFLPKFWEMNEIYLCLIISSYHQSKKNLGLNVFELIRLVLLLFFVASFLLSSSS